MAFPTMPRQKRAAYIDVPLEIRKRTSAGSRGWRKGWPDDCPAGADRARVSVQRPSDGKTFSVSVDARLEGLFTAFLTYIQKTGHELRTADELSANGKKQGGNGSFVCRAIKGSNPPAPSNHSTGTALDLWSRSNPQLGRSMDRQVAFVSTIHPTAVRLAAAGLIYWGGWYWDTTRRKYVDAMHFEYMSTPANVERAIRQMRTEYQRISGEQEPLPPDPDQEGEAMTDEQVRELQATLNAVGVDPPLVVDGVYGPKTEAAVEGLPATVDYQVDAAEAAAKAETKEAAIDAVEAI